jgi:hypothetical protein
MTMLADLIVFFELMAFGLLERVVSAALEVHEYLQSIF